MPTIAISPHLQYFYTDSGAPDASNYETLVIIHGHTYHGATFESLFKPAFTAGMRVIAINRRGYPYSSPFTDPEVELMTSPSSSTADLESFFEQHGANLGLFLDKLAIETDLPKGRNMTIAGWSNGGVFTLGIVAFINGPGPAQYETQDGNTLTGDDLVEMAKVRERLRSKVKGVILWDPPSICFGVPPPPNTYVPLYDESIPLKARGQAFGVWVASYFKHASITSHSISDLSQRDSLADPLPSCMRMTPAQLKLMTDLAGGGEWDTAIVSPRYMETYEKQAKKALFNANSEAQSQGIGPGVDICVLIGDANPWPVIYGMWAIEGMMESKLITRGKDTKQPVGFKIMHGANHFVFWDNPKSTIEVLRECIAGDMGSVIVDPVVTVCHD